MKPGWPPQRRAELKTNTPLERRAEFERSGRLRRRSEKTAALYVQRRALVAELLLYPTVCEVPQCTNRATDPHEPKTRARGGSILDRANVRLICGPHHSEIHDTEPEWAYRLGFLKHSWKEDGAA